jgi:hypothetical protein
LKRLPAPLVAFLFHAPGLWLTGVRLGPATLRTNALALGVTLAAMAAAWVQTASVVLTVALWLAGHLAWGAWLARLVSTGAAQR